MDSGKAGLAMLAAAALATRLYALYATNGFIHPDNLFQLLEPAHKLAFGYGITPWEYVLGIRSWVQPAIIAAVYLLGAAAGLHSAWQIILLNRALAVAFSLALLYAVYRLARETYGPRAAENSLMFGVFSWTLWHWSADTSSHIPSALFSCLALSLYWRGLSSGSSRVLASAGACLGFAFMFRFDALLFAASIAAYSMSRGRTGSLRPFLSGLAAVAVLQGLSDLVMWGSFLHSPLEFLRQNLVGGMSARFGTQPFYFLLGVFGLHATALFMLPYAYQRRPQFAYLAANGAVFLAAYSLVGHKETRFLIPVLPVFFCLAGRGLEAAEESLGRWAKTIVVAFTVLLSSGLALAIGWGDNSSGPAAMEYVGERSDASGVAYAMEWGNSGGYAHLHRRIPMVQAAEEAVDPTFNRVRCLPPDRDYVGYQCSPPGDIFNATWINYIVVDDGAGLQMPVEGFNMVHRRGTASVYRRS
jgi:GPI mannosyltransferase 3